MIWGQEVYKFLFDFSYSPHKTNGRLNNLVKLETTSNFSKVILGSVYTVNPNKLG